MHIKGKSAIGKIPDLYSQQDSHSTIYIVTVSTYYHSISLSYELRRNAVSKPIFHFEH